VFGGDTDRDASGDASKVSIFFLAISLKMDFDDGFENSSIILLYMSVTCVPSCSFDKNSSNVKNKSIFLRLVIVYTNILEK
jgi:hypothetical protein